MFSAVQKNIFVLFLFFPFLVHSQRFELEDVRTFGSTASDVGIDVVVDDSGNQYLIGLFADTMIINGVDQKLISKGKNDAYIQKISITGNILWTKTFGGQNNDIINSINFDVDQKSIYITGNFIGSVDFDPSEKNEILSSINNTQDFYVLKLSLEGDYQSCFVYGDIGNDKINGLTVTSNGDLILVGSFDTKFYDSYSKGYDDAFVLKASKKGEISWIKTIGGIYNEKSHSVTISNEFVFITGTFQDEVDFDSSLKDMKVISKGGYDMFVSKYDLKGDFYWVRTGGGKYHEYGIDIQSDRNGGVVVTGTFQELATFIDPDQEIVLDGNGYDDVFVGDLDQNGTWIWLKSFGSFTYDYISDLKIDRFGQIYLLGSFFDQVDFDPSTSENLIQSNGQYDVYLLKLTEKGDFRDVINIGGENYDYPYGFFLFNDNRIYVTGAFLDNFSVGTSDLSYTSVGRSDVFYIGFTQDVPLVSRDSISSCEPIKWRDGKTYLKSDSTSTFYLTSSSGVDSIIILNLDLTIIDTTLKIDGLTLRSNENDATFQWFDCFDNMSLIENNLDSILTFLDYYGNYAVQISKNGCVDTSSCVDLTLLALSYNDCFKDVNLYPNPNTGGFTVDFGYLVYPNISIYSTQGVKVFEQLGVSSKFENFSLPLDNGIYVVKISTNKGSKNIKLFIDK